MKIKVIAISLFFLFSSLSISFAYRSTASLGISDDTAIVVVWKNKHGYYRACGPVQRVSTGYKDRDKIIDLASNCDDVSYVGRIGKYSIYSCGVKLKSYDYNARRCMD